MSDSITAGSEAGVSSPGEGEVFMEGDDVTFDAWCVDLDTTLTVDGSLAVWCSSIDGRIGEGAPFNTAVLSVGDHVISVRFDGYTARGLVGIKIVRNTRPDQPEALQEM